MPADETDGRLILIVDDDRLTIGALREHLGVDRFRYLEAYDGPSALKTARDGNPDLVLMDVEMPGLGGVEVCRILKSSQKQFGFIPVILMTARGASGRVEGLELGADDYLVKPFAREELIARLRALLRRTGWEGEDETLRFEDLELDPLAHEARRGGRTLELTRTEFLLLELLMRHPRQVLSRATIFDRVWGYDFGPASNSLEVYVGYLRRKTEAAGEPRLVHTVRGVGYALRSPR